MDVLQSLSAKSDGSRKVCKPTVGENHVSAVESNVGSLAHGNSNISALQSNGIVDTVTYHYGLSLPLLFSNDFSLSFRKH